MKVITARNVHAALPEGLRLLDTYGERRSSRNGDVIVTPFPVMTVYEHPFEQVLFWPEREANPFFHLMESLWMLGGRRDAAWISEFNLNMRKFSDDGEVFHGAYGYRWRLHFAVDQLNEVCQLLIRKPDSRRAVIQMWDVVEDLSDDEDGASKDLPCNTHIYLLLRGDHLDLTVMCRSNDIIWGAYGTNAVHFGILQEYLAARLGVGVGRLYQFSNNYHAYLDIFEKTSILVDRAADPHRSSTSCPYTRGDVFHSPLVSKTESFDKELAKFLDGGELVLVENSFFGYAELVRSSYRAWRNGRDYEVALGLLDLIKDDGLGRELDWKRACREWLQRRAKGKTGKNAERGSL